MKHAALYESGGQHYLYKGGAGGTCCVVSPAKLELFIPILAEHAIDCLWIMPDTQLSTEISWSDFNRIDQNKYRVFFPMKKGKPTTTRPAFVSLRKQSEKFEKEFFLAFPEHGEWNANDGGKWYLPAPHMLGCTINYLSRELGLDIMWGPGNLGMKILKRIFEKKKWAIENLVLTEHMEEALNQAVTRPVWRKWGGLSPDQAQMKYLHGYDKNSQYLGAAQSVFLGNGQPERVGPDAFSLGNIGFWRYQLLDVSESAFDGYDLPCPLNKAQWASTNLLLFAQESGIEFEILEGLIWREPQPKKYLEEWAKEMRRHRENLRKEDLYKSEIARENAEGTVKAAANSLMGRLATPGSKELYKPDWNMLIVHQAITNQMYSFKRNLRDYGIKPVLVTTDSFWIVSDEPDPAKAIPDILKYQREQRGCKHIGTVPMTPDIIEAFTAQLPEDINVLLKKMIEEVCYA